MDFAEKLQNIRVRLANALCQLENKEIDHKTAREETQLCNKELKELQVQIRAEKQINKKY